MVWQAGASMIHRGCKQHLVAGQPVRKNKNAAFPKEGGVLFDRDT